MRLLRSARGLRRASRRRPGAAGARRPRAGGRVGPVAAGLDRRSPPPPGRRPVPERTFDDPEHRLYLRLAAEGSDAAHSRYNAWIGRLVSFENALECAS
jgi:hypothetical protein